MLENSFEHNQSYPVIIKPPKRSSFGAAAKAVPNLTGEDYHSYSYVNEFATNKTLASVDSNESSILEIEQSSVGSIYFSDKRKALITISVYDFKILTSNKIACELFGYSYGELIGLDFSTLLGGSQSTNEAAQNLLQEVQNALDGSVIASGKVIEVVHKRGFEMPVSVWLRKVKEGGNDSRCVLVLEPVQRISSSFTFDDQGEIVACDEKFGFSHGFLHSSDVIGQNLSSLMPSFMLPNAGSNISQDLRLQRLTSSNVQGSCFPVTVYISSQECKWKKYLYHAQVWAFPNLSGIVSCTLDGSIQGINDDLSLSLFGYSAEEMTKKNIFDVIPEALDHMTACNLYNSAVPQIEMDSRLSFSYHEGDQSGPRDDLGNMHDSWIEVSLSTKDDEEIKPCGPVIKVNDKQSNFLDKVNLLLNSRSPLVNKEDFLQTGTEKCCKETSSDSAIHSECGLDKCGKSKASNGKELTIDGGKESLQSSYSDYHSNDGSRAHSGVQQQNENPENVSLSSQVPISPHDASSFVIVEEQATNHEIAPRDKLFGQDKLLKNLANVHRLSHGSEVTSTPLERGYRSQSRLSSRDHDAKSNGSSWFKGKYRHKDGTMVDLWCAVERIGNDQMLLFKVYSQLKIPSCLNLDATNCTMITSVSTLPSLSPSNSLLDVNRTNESNSNIGKSLDFDENIALLGEISKKYDLVRNIGMGAFGFVKIAQSKETKRECVIKFIKKEKILDECWVLDEETDGLIPMEVSLLLKFRHPNIVRVHEYFENEYFFSMVMVKHGTNGMDLFEFIDRCVGMDEPLCSYIYRQVVSAVDYLHAHSILHRDIKDENIIIDENFVCQLIDFGSATFMRRDKLFATFCGTVEYCSPEVLLGNKYRGPELEMWAMGVTLYTLVFGENPYKNVEETLKGDLCPPFTVSPLLSSLIDWLLQPEPDFRCTMIELKECPWLTQVVNINLYKWKDIVRTPVSSLDSSNVQVNVAIDNLDVNPPPYELNEENLCEQLSKLATISKNNCQRKILAPIDNHARKDLNNTI